MREISVLVACEYSGTVRDAFEDVGCNAWSCDILPTESEQTKASGKHLQRDVLSVINDPKWDIMIAHPPCTYLSFAYAGKDRYSVERLQKKVDAYKFFVDLWSAPIEHICIENPMGYAHTGLLPYTQIVEPYYFGDPYTKRTCLWLKNLPKLTYYKPDIFGDEGGGVQWSARRATFMRTEQHRAANMAANLFCPLSVAQKNAANFMRV
ncbi:MAG: hypothetical protein LBG17_00165 [Bacteroidales bacterium]|nr:hypothetical protein [Bacteroidales bacterium]